MAIISPSGKLASKTTGRTARLIATTVVAIIGTLIAIKASSNFITDLTNFLVFTLYLLVPWTAINLTDFYLIRHGNYDIPELFKVHGKYGKVNWFALVVYALTVLVEWPFMNNAWIVGAAAKALGGADIAWIVGLRLRRRRLLRRRAGSGSRSRPGPGAATPRSSPGAAPDQCPEVGEPRAVR